MLNYFVCYNKVSLQAIFSLKILVNIYIHSKYNRFYSIKSYSQTIKSHAFSYITQYVVGLEAFDTNDFTIGFDHVYWAIRSNRIGI